MTTPFKTLEHSFDVCVVGGGISGICAAVSAARHGAKTALIQDRPVLGGNASSEIRMWVCGCGGKNLRETGIVDELWMENQYRNPYKNYYLWDSVMYEIVTREKNLTLFLNCSCLDGECKNNRISSILCWQLTTQTYHKFSSNIFIDCSGDSILAPISSAEFHVGRESVNQTGESMARPVADDKTMGNSCLIQYREFENEREFIAPSFARKLTDQEFLGRMPNLESVFENFWYLELGGTSNTIDNAEDIRERLYSLAFGMWNYIKNHPSCREKNKNYDVDFIGALPGKRESRRYVGDHILCQQDIESAGHFEDIIAYGGWDIDDHNPGGFDRYDEPANSFNGTPRPYGISYRCLYSKNVENLMFAGRNISATHIAMSSTRVMATCGILGQAAGTAAALAKKYNTTPRGINQHIYELQQTLMNDDCFIPFIKRDVNAAITSAKLISDMDNAENLRNGFDRPVLDKDNGAFGLPGCCIKYEFNSPLKASYLRIILDNDLNYETATEAEKTLTHNMFSSYPLNQEKCLVAKTLVSDLKVIFTYADGSEKVVDVSNNYFRHIRIPIEAKPSSVEVIFEKTHGSEKVHVFSVDVI